MHPLIVERILGSRECSGSGRPHLEVAEKPAMENKCVGSKRNMTDALKRRHVLYQPTLTIRPPKPHLAEAERDLSGPVSHSRRRLLQLGSSSALLGLAARSSQAVSMPQAVDDVWSAVGGGPADLTFPEAFLGHWLAESTLSAVETPLGPDFVPNPQVVERARREDLKKKIRYEVSYIRNKKQKVIIDRRFNLASLMNVYMGRNVVEQQDIAWNPDDPNRMAVQLPGGTQIVTRVVRRSEENPGADRVNTSEFFEQVFQVPYKVEPKVKASQCFTKYKWRTPQQAAQTGGPLIVATQVVSDYLTPYDGEGMMLRAQNRPVVVYTYTMTFRRAYNSSLEV